MSGNPSTPPFRPFGLAASAPAMIGSRYTITVCPVCDAGPLYFEPCLGMHPRTFCANGHLVIVTDAKRIEVEPCA